MRRTHRMKGGQKWTWGIGRGDVSCHRPYFLWLTFPLLLSLHARESQGLVTESSQIHIPPLRHHGGCPCSHQQHPSSGLSIAFDSLIPYPCIHPPAIYPTFAKITFRGQQLDHIWQISSLAPKCTHTTHNPVPRAGQSPSSQGPLPLLQPHLGPPYLGLSRRQQGAVVQSLNSATQPASSPPHTVLLDKWFNYSNSAYSSIKP